MKNLTNVFLFVFTACLMLSYSCKKDENKPAGDPDACLLTKITWVAEAGSDDSDEVFIFKYDENRRVVRFDLVGEPVYVTLEYDENGYLINTSTYENSVKVMRSYYTWSGNVITEILELKNESDIWVELAKIVLELDDEDKIIKLEEHWMENEMWIFGYYELYTWANQNITKSEEWEPDYKKHKTISKLYNKIMTLKKPYERIKSEKDTKESTTTYEYDDQMNAFTSLGLIWGYITLNNPTKSITTTQYYTQTSVYVYEYNEKGFPTKSTETHTYSDGEEYTGIILYEYDCQ